MGDNISSPSWSLEEKPQSLKQAQTLRYLATWLVWLRLRRAALRALSRSGLALDERARARTIGSAVCRRHQKAVKLAAACHGEACDGP